jgi:ABC-type multidrug transport system ATPase subunit
MNFAASIYGMNWFGRGRRLDAALDLVELSDRDVRSRTAGQLSGGMQRRLALAAALVHDPQVIFLDEPTAGIDPVSRRELWELLLDLSGQGKTIFVTTHYTYEAERCHNVGFMFMGKLVAYGNPREVETTFNGGSILEIRTTSTIGALRALQNCEGLGSVQVFYDTLHIITPESDEALPRIRETLGRHGIDVISAGEVVPSLEDIFIHFIQEARG